MRDSFSGSHRGVKLSGIFPTARYVGCDDMVATRCTDEVTGVRQGDLFVARSTAMVDGHEQVARALARGAAGVIAERIVPTGGTPLCLVRDADWAMARLCHALAGDPGRAMEVIAITGTSGKTTTSWLTAAVLAEMSARVGVLSDLGCLGPDGADPEVCDLARPARLAEWLGRLRAGGCSHVVLEVSSRMLATHALAGVPCDTVVVTNIDRAHLDLHGTRTAYHRIKRRILDTLPSGGCLVADGDGGLDRLLGRAVARGDDLSCLTFGTRAGCDVRARTVERGLHGRTFLLSAGDHTVPVSVDTPVRSFTRNALAAAAVGLRFGAELHAIARGLQAADRVPLRVERLDRGQPFALFIDASATGHALAATLGSLRRLTPGRLAIVASEPSARRLAPGGFVPRVRRWCDACVVAPAGMVEEHCGADDLAAYAKIDRLLGGLGPKDCLVVLDGPAGSPGPGRGGVPLAAVIDGWLHLAHGPHATGRRAA
jgi:UDP-N-acetylmuramoyl-L-alanyl-D-glutamate--2,6-diaminopimelate ligase